MKTNMFVRVAGPVIAISAIPLVVGVASAWQVNTQYKRVSRQLSLDVAGLRAGEELAIGIRDVRTSTCVSAAMNNLSWRPAAPEQRSHTG
jgi:hypothetical protein